ncbi:MAG TPA: YbjN domain-containing protein [Polyangia bacterium]|nr:YbjN domain-containing protein [Polyangia bacterium]
MNAAEQASCELIEKSLSSSPAYQKVEDRLYVVKQGSSIVMINVVPWGSDKAVVRCIAQLVKGVDLKPELAKQLLEMNAVVRFGAFGFVPDGSVITFGHSILGGATMDPIELLATIRDVALIADEYDDRIARKYGGQTMIELLEESALRHLLEARANEVWDRERN